LSLPKKVGTLPVEGSDEQKRTNEIGMAIPVLDHCSIAGKTITADALLTQRTLAMYLHERQANYHFTVKGNQPGLEQELRARFALRGLPEFAENLPPAHGRIETRRIWVQAVQPHELDFPHVSQIFRIEREVWKKKAGQHSLEVVLGITSQTPQQASPQQVLKLNRGHWIIESTHYLLDWNYDEDRCRIRTGHGPENITRLRRFALGILKSFQPKTKETIATMMRPLSFSVRRVFDYLRMTKNAAPGR
jgi:predicted transposase YbfD/YdcC